SADGTVAFGVQRSVQAQEIRLAKKGREVDEFRSGFSFHLGCNAMPGMVKNPHRKAAASACYGLADMSEAVKAERFPVKFRSPKQIPQAAFPLSFANVTVRL